MGYCYKEIEKYADSINGGVVIEIGGDRGEGSSAFIKDFSKRHNLEFHSIDIAPIVFANQELYGGVHTHIMDGTEFLKTFSKKIKFAYLDNFYWLFDNPSNLEVLKTLYSVNPETNNRDSMEAHLQQAIEVDRLADNPCYVLFDDTWGMPDKSWGGKGGLAIPYLLKKGWKVLNEVEGKGEDIDAYVLMVKKMRECFFTVYDERAREMTQGMINSVKHWYPDIPMEALEIEARNADGGFDLRGYCDDILKHGYRLLDKYDRIIYVDPDSVMCNKCPDLFDDYDLGCVLNNTVCGPEYGGTKGNDYINAGLCVCTNKEIWKQVMDEYDKRNNIKWECLNHQNALNYVYHQVTKRVKLLEFDDRVYGISGLANYQDMEIRNDELYLPNNKKLCIFHAAGVYWKTNCKINFDYIKNEEAREKIKSYTNA